MEEPASSNRSAIAALIVVALLVVGGLLLMQRIRASSALQDCVMSGRTNCAPVRSGR